MVHMNGLRLEESDYTASTTTVTLGSGAAAGDEVTITAFVTFESADHYNKSTADTRYVNTSGDTMTGNLGINETSPSGSLHVKGTSSTHGKIILEAGGSGGSANNNFMEFNKHDGTKLGELEVGESVTNGGSLVFKTTPSGGSATTRMTINHNGIVTMPNQPVFGARGYSAAGTTIGSNMAPMRWQSVHTNVGNHFNNTTGLFTFPVSGRYYFDCNINLKATANQWLGIYMMYNNTQHVNSWANTSDSTYQNTIVSGVVDATANDTMSFCYHNTYSAPSSSSNDIKYNHANIYLIG